MATSNLLAGPSRKSRPTVVIVGAGFAGLYAAKGLARAEVDVVIIDKRNYHLFQPLLYQVAVAALPPSDVAWPIRSILRRQKNVTVRLGAATGFDVENQSVALEHGHVEFDYLVVATGVTHSYFGHPQWADVAPGLKTIDDATNIRRRILMAFEKAEATGCDDERKRLMRFVVVGGGPTGVELAGTIAELARHTLARDFRHIDPKSAKVVLIEAGERVLPTFQQASSIYTARELRRLGVEVRVGSTVTNCDGNGVEVNGARLESATIIWAAGVEANAAGAWLNAKMDRARRIVVGPDLTVGSHQHIFAIGDAANVTDADGRQVPGIAPAAKQQGRFVARLIAASVVGRPPPGRFVYKHAGNLATIGRGRAVMELSSFRLLGLPAWLLWGVAHIYFLIGVPSPLFVAARWVWEYVTYGRGARLITGDRATQSRCS